MNRKLIPIRFQKFKMSVDMNYMIYTFVDMDKCILEQKNWKMYKLKAYNQNKILKDDCKFTKCAYSILLKQ